MRLVLDRSVLLGVGLVVALIVVNAGVGIRNASGVNEQNRLVAQTHEVLELSGDLMITLLEAETSQRGFLATGEDEFLDLYRSALAKLEDRIQSLENKTRDDPKQMEYLQRIRERIVPRLEALKDAIRLGQERTLDGPLLEVMRRGKQHMNAVREVMSEMRQSEHELLADREKRSVAAHQYSITSILLGAGIALAMVIGFVIQLQRGQRMRNAVVAEIYEHRERLRTILASIGDAVVATDIEGNVTFLNPVAQALTGWQLADAVGKPLTKIFNIVNENTRTPVENPALRALNEERVIGQTHHAILISNEGSECPIEERAAPIVGESGEILGAVLVFRDISERKRDDAAKMQQSRLAVLRAESSAALSKTVELQSMLQRCTEVLVQQLDVTYARIWTLNDAEGILELQASAGLEARADGPHSRIEVGELQIGRIAQNRRPYLTNDAAKDSALGEMEVTRREDLVSFAGFPLLVDDRVVGVLALTAHRPLNQQEFEDLRLISENVAQCIERKQVEESLRKSATRYRVLTEVSPQIVWLGTADGQMVYFNHKWYEYTQLSREQSLGEGWLQVIHPDHRQWIQSVWLEAVQSHQPYEMEVPIRHGAEGAYRWYLVRGLSIRNSAGKVVQWIGVATDIHDRKLAEEAVRDAARCQDELYQKLREADRRKDEFLATLAHELRNPLAPIRNALQILRIGGDSPEQFSQVREMMERQLAQMVRLVDDLLDVSRITRGKIELHSERLSIATVLENAVETSRPLIDNGRHELTVNVPAEPLWISGDATRLAQVVANLLNNAAKYTPQGGHIWLSAAREGEQAVIRVRDSGVGIPPAMLTHVFEMFTQVDRHLERSQGGLGIGLTLVKRMVEMHAGTVEARSDGQDKGSEFIIRLPLAPEYLLRDQSATGSLKESAEVAKVRRILVVDDNQDSAQSLGMLLKLMGNEVRLAYDGPSALAVLQEFSPTMALLDIGLPGMTGYELARKIRGTPRFQNVLLVAQTGWGQDEDRRRSAEAGFDAHLVKPVDPAVLQELLQNLKPGSHVVNDQP